jgi:hypothetical protein
VAALRRWGYVKINQAGSHMILPDARQDLLSLAVVRFGQEPRRIMKAMNIDDKKRGAHEKLEAMLMEGVQGSEPTEMTRQDWTDIRQEALRQFEARKAQTTA